MKRLAYLLLSIFLLLLPVARNGSGPSGIPPEQSPVSLTPDVINIGAFYNGVTIRVEGMAPPDTQAIVVIRGEKLRESLNRRGRIGPIWVNVGKVQISEAPSLFLSFSQEPVEKTLGRESITENSLSQEAIEKQMAVEPKAMDQPLIRANFIKMKIEEGVYQTHDDAVRRGHPGPQGSPFVVEFPWPKRASPGSYELRVYQCKDGKVVSGSAVSLRVIKAGFPEWMANLANRRASLYGALAVIAALAAGLGIDFVTSKMGRIRALGH